MDVDQRINLQKKGVDLTGDVSVSNGENHVQPLANAKAAQIRILKILIKAQWQ